MDRELEQRWRTACRPFDEAILRHEDLLPLSRLRADAEAVVKLLASQTLIHSLRTLDDWHEHDGYITTYSVVDWAELERVVSTEASMFASRQGEDHVRRAFYPEDATWLFRFYLLDQDEDELHPGIWGTLDLSGSGELCERALNTITTGRTDVTLGRAKQYFDHAYAG